MAEVVGKGVSRDVGKVRHRHRLHCSAGRVADQARLEQPGNQARRGLDEPCLQEHLDHLRTDHPDMGRAQLDAIDGGNLGDHLVLHGPRRHQVERGDRVGENGPGRHPLKLFNDRLSLHVPFLGKLILRVGVDQVGPKQEVPGAERIAFTFEDGRDPVAERSEVGRLEFENRRD